MPWTSEFKESNTEKYTSVIVICEENGKIYAVKNKIGEIYLFFRQAQEYYALVGNMTVSLLEREQKHIKCYKLADAVIHAEFTV